MSEPKTNHFLELLKNYWFLIIFGIGIVGSLISLYTQVQYVVAAVNPESIVEYRVQQAVLETKREARWCVGKIIIGGEPITPKQFLSCLD